MWCPLALKKHDPIAALQLLIARVEKGLQRLIPRLEVFALHPPGGPLKAPLLYQRPAAKQILLQKEVVKAGRTLGAAWGL
jgi:hypothetical protein